jgi:hypothetical protein
MLFSLLYMVLRVIFRLVPSGDERDREVEILVLRHQVKVLRRKAGRPKLGRLDRLLLAAAARILPEDRWSSFIVNPANPASLASGAGQTQVDLPANAHGQATC